MNRFKLVLAGLFLFTLSSFVYASGSHSSDSGNMANSDYNKGKTVVHKQLICDACPLKGAELNKNTAKDLVVKLNQGDASLGSLQQSDVKSAVAYLEERYSL